MPLKDPEARKEYWRNWMRVKYATDAKYRKKHRGRVVKNNAVYKERNKEILAEFRANGCALCPEKESCCLSAHHLDPQEKDFDIFRAVRLLYSAQRIRDELAKCICVCENCHRKLHAGLISPPSI